MFGINTGGPAFPRPGYLVDGPSRDAYEVLERQAAVTDPQTGMTLRDWFAGQALCGLMADPTFTPTEGESRREWRATTAIACYDLADALLVARSLPHDLPDRKPRRPDRDPDVDEQAPSDTPRGDQ